jgi:hypothetical protein
MDDNGFPSMRDDVKGAGRAIWYGILAIVVIGVLGWLVWGLTVATSDIKGRGDQQIQINSATNRTFQYEHFLQLDGTIRTQAQQADAARAALARFEKQHPDASQDSISTGQLRAQMEQDATGAEQICRANVNQYNNEAESSLRQKFVDARLPIAFPSAVCTDVSQLPPSISGVR